VKWTRSGLPNPSTVRWILQLKPPRLRPSAWSPCFWGTGRTGMGAHNGRVDHPMLSVGLTGQGCQHALPHACDTLAHKALVNAVPGPILSRQQAPLCPTPADPFHGFNKTAAGGFVSAYIGVRLPVQERPELAPLFVAQSNICHVHILWGSGQMSTEPSFAWAGSRCVAASPNTASAALRSISSCRASSLPRNRGLILRGLMIVNQVPIF